MAEPAIVIDRVTKRFGSVTAVDRASLEIAQDEFFALLGPSGSGKTTLLRIVAGLEAPDEGRVLIHGNDVTRLPPYARKVGMVFQDFLLFPHRRVAENITFPLKMQNVAKAEMAERLQWIIKLLRLDGLEGRYPHQLSGGQQQRVALARALAGEPAVLLLDEPLSNLDARLRQEMRVELKAIQRRVGAAILYVTHDQDEALALADRVAVMGAGVLHQVDRPEAVYAAPADRFVAEFMGYVGFLPADVAGPARVRLTRVPGGPIVPARLPAGAAGAGVLAFRPAQVELGEPAAGVPGRVVARVYRGEFFEYRIGLGPHEFAAAAARAIPEGEAVGVSFRDPLFFPGV
ncbi:MAG TPA: ABC transporter ATP-binding protein [Alphaproteobacteria bacterium]|nr:ABC transporter ATP-binding protein [Alphaproteobacteria bacterium]